jgi:hypothetical protein
VAAERNGTAPKPGSPSCPVTVVAFRVTEGFPVAIQFGELLPLSFSVVIIETVSP